MASGQYGIDAQGGVPVCGTCPGLVWVVGVRCLVTAERVVAADRPTDYW